MQYTIKVNISYEVDNDIVEKYLIGNNTTIEQDIKNTEEMITKIIKNEFKIDIIKNLIIETTIKSINNICPKCGEELIQAEPSWMVEDDSKNFICESCGYKPE